METSKLFKLTALGVGLIVLGVVVYILTNRQKAKEGGINEPARAGSVAGVRLQETEVLKPEEGVVEVTKNNQKKYTHAIRGFSFVYPGNFTLSYLPDGNAESFLLSEQGGKGQVQIYCQTLQEAVVITPERIKQDIPAINMKDIKTFSVGNVPAVSFVDAGINTREVWFARGVNFCQISAFVEFSGVIDDIINKWEWQK